MAGLGLRDHAGEVGADDRLLDERLPEHLALLRPLHALLRDHPRVTVPPDDHLPALDVEVAHRLVEALARRADEILRRHDDVVHRDL